MATAHIAASPGDFAKTVLMPGDPLRAKFIAETFLDDPKLVNNVRGVQGYTGRYRGVPISVMASGMGMPSMGIYSHELFQFFGVENILRIGSAGALQQSVCLRDLVLAQAACTDSNFAAQFHLPGAFAPIASYPLLELCIGVCKNAGVRFHVGNVVTSDCFYADREQLPPGLDATYAWGKMGVLAVEMETAALYLNAARFGKRALSILTVSDHVLTGEATNAAERETTFRQMMQVALDTACEAQRL